MATITEDYVSFETAKLLKEKGFNENTEHKIWYVIKQFSTGCHWNSCTYKVGDTTREYDGDCCIPMPTLQMAMKWLREVHNLFIQICIIPHTTITIEQKYYFFTIHKNRRTLAFRKDFPSGYYFTYEEACEAAIKYCLKVLI